MPTAILTMESGSRGSHVHRHGRSHDARGSFSKLSERICDKGFKAVSRLVSYQRRYCQWSLDLADGVYTDTDVVMMREFVFKNIGAQFVFKTIGAHL